MRHQMKDIRAKNQEPRMAVPTLIRNAAYPGAEPGGLSRWASVPSRHHFGSGTYASVPSRQRSGSSLRHFFTGRQRSGSSLRHFFPSRQRSVPGTFGGGLILFTQNASQIFQYSLFNNKKQEL